MNTVSSFHLRKPWSFLVLLWGGSLLALSLPAAAQDQDDPTYWYNKGNNEAIDDTVEGEFELNLGGHIPMDAYGSQHDLYYSGPPDLEADMRSSLHDLEALRSAILSGTNGAVDILARIDGQGADDGVVLDSSGSFTSWWGQGLKYWNYRLNGGYVQIVWDDSSIQQQLPILHLLIRTLQTHVQDLDGPRFLPLTGPDGIFEGGLPWTNNDTNLNPIEQWVQNGHVLVSVHENVAQSFWIQMQRNQEAAYFVRNVFLPDKLVQGQSLGKAFATGGSWGAIVSSILGMLTPNQYAGVGNTGTGDFSFIGGGDWADLRSHLHAGLGIQPPAWSVNGGGPGYTMIDLLGVRCQSYACNDFDTEWDFAIYSPLYRTGDLEVSFGGLIGTEDNAWNYHWDFHSPLTSVSSYQPRLFKNLSHGGFVTQSDGVNEYYYYNGSEWSDLIGNATTVASSNEFVPSGAPPYPVRVDPYSHTLRHVHCSGICPITLDLLTPFDLNTDLPTDTIGQGVYPGNFDTMAVDDLDDDGASEVFFGNYDGFFHVLEIDTSGEFPLLVDEYRSPWLGTGLFSMTRQKGGARKVFLGDTMGHLHKITPMGHDSYSSATIASPDVAQILDSLYYTLVGSLYRGEFDTSTSGSELLALNRYLDWVVLGQDGTYQTQLNRANEALGPGLCVVVSDIPGHDEDPFALEVDELIIPCLDGHLWFLRWNSLDSELQRTELMYTDRALYRVVDVDDDGDGVPEQLLLFGRNDSLASPNRVMLYDFNSSSIVSDVSTDVPFGHGNPELSFAWTTPPSESQNWTFAIAAGREVQEFQLSGGALQGGTPKALPLHLDPEDGERLCCRITAMEYLEQSSGGRDGYLIVAASNGRIYFLDDNSDGTLSFSRPASDEVGGTFDAPWHSNRTFGHEMAIDLSTKDGGDEQYLYIAEFNSPIAEGSPNTYRLGRLDLDPADPTYTFDEHWEPDVTDATHDLEARNAGYVNSNSGSTRFLEVADRNGDGDLESYCLAETGTVMGSGSNVRQFSTQARSTNLFGSGLVASAGYVYEAIDVSVPSYRVLTNDTPSLFRTPRSDTNLYTNGSATGDWWYPTFGTHYVGQISSHPVLAGTSMTSALLGDPNDDFTLKEHIVTGTVAGYVYAVLPGDTVDSTTTKQSTLSYASDDLGWYATGLDTGDLDGDGEDEIVVGILVDDAGFDEWYAGDTESNRGGVIILHTTQDEWDAGIPTCKLVGDKITGDSTLGTGRGFGAGVFGIKIDNVDGQGPKEIWATDALGHIYLLKDDGSGNYVAWFRSGHVGAHPGLYNLIFPIKSQPTSGTQRLAVVSSGYLMVFDVNNALLSQ